MATACLTEELYEVPADEVTITPSGEDILSWKGEDLQSNEFVMEEQLSVTQRTELATAVVHNRVWRCSTEPTRQNIFDTSHYSHWYSSTVSTYSLQDTTCIS